MPRQSHVFRRYVLLYALFGLVVGLRYGTDAWVFEILSTWVEGKHLLMACAMVGMLAGDFLGARVSDRYSRVAAVLLAAAGFALSALLGWLALEAESPDALFFGALAFGLGLGVQHSSLDAWFRTATLHTSTRKPTDAEWAWGYTAYTGGFFAGQALAFPLMYGFNWDLPIAQYQNRNWVPLHLPVYPAPYLLAVVGCLLVVLARPPSAEFEPAGAGGAGPAAAADEQPRGFIGTIRGGGIAFVMIVLVGAGVSFLIQHIDTFGATDLLAQADTVWKKTKGLGVLHLAAAVWVGLFAWTLEMSERFNTLSPPGRSGVLGLNLGAILFLLAAAMAAASAGSDLLLIAVLIGFGHALLNTLPQVVKSAVLDTAGEPDQGTASAILGVSKRVPNLLLSLALMARGGGMPSDQVMYVVLIGVTVLSLLALAIYAVQIRRYRVTAVLICPDYLEGAEERVRVLVRTEPNITARFSVRHDPADPDGPVRLRVRLYTTQDKRAFVELLVADLKGLPGVSGIDLDEPGGGANGENTPGPAGVTGSQTS